MSHRPRSVFPVERQVLAHEDSQADSAAQPEALVMAVPEPDGEPVMPRSA